MSGPGQTYVVALFVDPIIEDTNWSRTTVSALYSAGSICAFLGAVIAGWAFDRFGARVVFTAVAGLFGLTTVLMGQISHPVHLFLGFWGIRSLGQTALPLVATSTVNVWFVRLRGKATAITLLGSPIAQISLPPLVFMLIVTTGWRDAWMILGVAIWFLLLPPAILLVRRSPESVGLKPDLDRRQPIGLQHQSTDLHEENWTAKQAMRTKAFWLLIFAGTAGALIGTGLMFHHISIMNSRGIGNTEATLILSITAGAAVLSTIGTGYLLDRIPNRLLLAIGQIILMAAMLWTLAIYDSWQAVIYGILIGLTQGLNYTTMKVIFPNYFGRKHLGSITGFVTIGMVVSGGLGPLPFGALYQLTGNYNLAILSFLVLPVLCALAALLASPPTSSPRPNATDTHTR